MLTTEIQESPSLSETDKGDNLIHYTRYDDENTALCGEDITFEPYVDEDTEANCKPCIEIFELAFIFEGSE